MPRIIIHPDGRREVAEEPTEAPQVGVAPRLADGTMLGSDGLPMAPATAEPARARRRRPAPATPTQAPAAPDAATPDAPAAQPEEA